MGECMIMANRTHTIKWKTIHQDTFMYGSKVTFHPCVTEFENPLMPSGLPIHKWRMLTNFSRDKDTPQLPILKRQHTYRFDFDYSVTPEQSVYFIFICLGKNGEEMERHIVKEKQVDIIFPEGAYSYEIKLMNAGAERLLFREMTITPLNEKEKPDMVISDVINEISDGNYKNIIIIEPTTFNYESVIRSVKHLNNVITVDQWWQGDLSSNIKKMCDYFAPLCQKSEVHFVGFGAKSNVIAQILGNLLESQTFRTTHDDSAILREMSEDLATHHVINNQTVIYDADYHHKDIPNYLADFINPVTKLNELDTFVLNDGGGDHV
ncbi:accessory Sec system protein Asp3 [Staphylococcus intermedius]|nr:accessory Sec system protein Asp3 [Staphylococcus intermedius]PCF79079.1 accessory Sec system protein Asp3 [Staphylococcus intermedius]PCF80052.1 accessory Sec system protein Asp3 [Staphylococcus intermedius]PCF89287.1 accessory Sec system protein Asp3 [Staphylococcus intermedius]PNZ48683.1 accessory Sec system protein Asp3 [Staphylococcus intermedius NCTC 11048]